MQMHVTMSLIRHYVIAINIHIERGEYVEAKENLEELLGHIDELKKMLDVAVRSGVDMQ